MSNGRERELADVFAALGDTTRLALVMHLLAVGALSATNLAEGQAISRQAIVKHLQVLEAAALVMHQRRGKEVLYALDGSRIAEARAFLDAISSGWDQALGRLKSLVEST
ncbi:helix-turn-helix transcriptional regulator [Rhizobium lusitanum]|uniref:DNA-binding transcriptional ArsR family regulator n=1 Tax=Rhizobium lusitanum TaxID=293958 RepID=A0A7X0IQ48_9HYPH|nr:metalloregulator ArsR/SmtB family transcription factor [Rhizobium lusitanum]MBB6484707.1 DNA-binding transcriptional ArsR family regulator [Rhizobium lusitanum]